ncbi:MAG TPA: hypothetical protein VG692_15950 [Gemmatimonadales bacterium]|nr:hypothetical protein [Gemmatimonadales bacterium]
MRLSLQQLRKQAKERLKALRQSDPAATLSAVQFTLARELGYSSWPRLVHALGGGTTRLAELEQVAADVHAGVRGDAGALRRLIAFTGSSYGLDRTRGQVREWLTDAAGGRADDDWTLDDARLAVARHYGVERWADLVASVVERGSPAPAAGHSLFYEIDWERRALELHPPLQDGDWDQLLQVMEDHDLTGLVANGQMTDAGLARLADLPQLTLLNLEGSQRMTDAGLAHLAAMPQLEELDLSGVHMGFTDQGLTAVGGLANLRLFRACWAPRISDAGVARLSRCPHLEEVNLMGTHTGDGAIASLGGMPELRRLYTGREVTDRGLARLREIPLFRTWEGTAPRYDMMDFDTAPTFLLLDGPFTDAGMRELVALDGIFGLSLFWHTSVLTPAGLAPLREMSHLGMLGCQDALCDDVAMDHIAALPSLRMLMAQGTVASDDGFVSLSRSRTLEHLWARDSDNLGSRGFRALAGVPSLVGVALNLAGVDDAALALLPEFPSLKQLVPMNVQDDAFRHVGRIRRLERLWCMYCRDTGDRATEQLAGLERLRTYYGGRTRITDRSLQVLGGMTSLEELEFWLTPGITNAGLVHLAALPRLRRLLISGAVGITREGLKALPSRVRVRYSG